jgi:hypothetical protein
MCNALMHRKRLLCASAGFCCFAAAIVLTPSDVRSQSGAPQPPRMEPPVAAPAQLAPVAPARDAFAPRIAVPDDAEPPVPVPVARIVPAMPPTGTLGAPALAARATRVTAIAIGSHPVALIERDGDARAITIGDRIGSARVTAIDEATVTLNDGTHLGISPADERR